MSLCNMNIILVDGATPNIAFELLTFFAWYTVIFLYMNSKHSCVNVRYISYILKITPAIL